MNDSLKRFLSLFSYTIFLVFIYLLGERYLLSLKQYSATNFNVIPQMIFSTLFPIAIGLLIAFPKFIIEFRKKGNWKLDWVKFIAIGIPILYFAIFPLVLALSILGGDSNLPLLNGLYRYPLSMYLPNELSGVVLGYLLLTVPCKKVTNGTETSNKDTIITDNKTL